MGFYQKKADLAYLSDFGYLLSLEFLDTDYSPVKNQNRKNTLKKFPNRYSILGIFVYLHMKALLVREALDFERGGNPLRQMNIGVRGFNELKRGDVVQCTKEVLINDRDQLVFYPVDKFQEGNIFEKGAYGIVGNDFGTGKDKYILNLICFEESEKIDVKEISNRLKKDPNYGKMLSGVVGVANPNTWNKFFKVIRPETLEESLNFERGGNPLTTIGIGRKALIKQWFDSVNVSPDEYTIDDDLHITVGGDLDLEDTAITKLPDNLTVGGWLDLRGTAITELSDNLTVYGDLDLRSTKVTELPDNLTVRGYLNLRYTAITKLPKSLKVEGEIYKDF